MSLNSPTPYQVLISILARASHLEEITARKSSDSDRQPDSQTSDSQSEAFAMISRRLKATVIRPLSVALAEMRPAHTFATTNASDPKATRARPTPSIEEIDADLWTLAKDATTIQVNTAVPVQTKEAAAGLQYLASERVAITDSTNDANQMTDTAAHMEELKAMQSEFVARDSCRD